MWSTESQYQLISYKENYFELHRGHKESAHFHTLANKYSLPEFILQVYMGKLLFNIFVYERFLCNANKSN